MTTYLIGRVTVRDAEKLKAYQALVPAIVAQYGGVFLARGGATGTLEGPEENRRMVIMAFASRQAAEAFYHSAEYQAAKALRAGAADIEFVWVDGLPQSEAEPTPTA